MVTKPTIVHKL